MVIWWVSTCYQYHRWYHGGVDYWYHFWLDDKKKLKRALHINCEHLILTQYLGHLLSHELTFMCCLYEFWCNFFLNLHSNIFFDLFTVVRMLLGCTWRWQLVHVTGVLTNLCNICRLYSSIEHRNALLIHQGN